MTDDERQIQMLDAAWNAAYVDGDADALDRILAEDWAAVDGAGRVVSKELILSRIRNSSATFTATVFDEFRLRIFGDAAIVTGRMTATGRDDGGAFDFNQRFTRIYAKSEGTWKAVAAQVTIMS